ncbi:ligase-associated DNA damage response endonuclease PdeM [Parvibaculum sp.]|uniref:ligase-associated DNA damage response endonuclease PdeM n=1 Tax=Parvibaculum sp. TaxID=2024848 RepID=UPI001D4AA912|nr:ligase-associated DNA damage response endonuclease PdeM [Parvibaculum sp.]MBX3490223.1 ligase-associated DNA damage response endonuclease PdeM [Parvibaculum sp.]MCW5729096.1 ligase-associated DNA damage response endonuclease PdeM [Parvibaculum sp.]
MYELKQDLHLEMHPALTVCGQAFDLTPEGAAFLAAERLLVAADLHLEKGSSYAARGIALPPYDTRATLVRLENLIARFRPRVVVALGDSFHDARADSRMAPKDAAHLARLTRSCDWIWISGNHDPAPPPQFGGEIMEQFRLGPLTFRHEPQAAPATGEIAGHLHPCAAVRVRGRRLRRRCYTSDGTRMVLPAFGAYAGGLNVLDRAFDDLLPGLDFHAWMMGGRTVVPVAARRLEAD